MMHSFSFRIAVCVVLLHLIGGAGKALAAPLVDDTAASLPADLSIAVVQQIMQDHSTPASMGKWSYTQGPTMYGIERIYRRTHNAAYLAYIQAWANMHVSERGIIDKLMDALEDMMPGLLMIASFEDTGDARYRLAADGIRRRFDTYPKTDDGGLWHGAKIEHQHELWLDGMYMSMPFYVRYEEAFGNARHGYDEAAKQLLIYAKHLNDPATGLLYHAYDETGESAWAQSEAKHSSFFWARSIVWYSVALLEVLEHMPKNHPDRPKLIALVRQLAAAFVRYQNATTGLWFNVVDKGSDPENWIETSASSMYIYFFSKAAQRGYIARTNARAACIGYRGIGSELSMSAAGGVNIQNICVGTVVGDLAYYLHRPRKTNDIHGTGQFLLMNEQMRTTWCGGVTK